MPTESKREKTIAVGISTCLLGQKVRFDGGHKHDRYITDILGPFFRFIPICPEVEIGMTIPREPVRLEGPPAHPRLVTVRVGHDWTHRMNRYAHDRVARRDLQNISGYILKKDSPSCGMERVKVYNGHGVAQRTGTGLFAAALRFQFPLLPMEEEGRLHDPHLRENFIVRVFAYHRLQELFRERVGLRQLVAFHTTHKYLLLAHSPAHYKQLGRLVASAKNLTAAALRDGYSRLFMDALALKATVSKNVNVLQHILGFLKDHLGPDEKQDILAVIEDYRRELVPLIVPLTLLRHYVERHHVAYIQDQLFLHPHPKELMLRNHV